MGEHWTPCSSVERIS